MQRVENKGCFKPGQSGNPKGKLKGARNRNSLLVERLLGKDTADTKQIIEKVIECAKDGQEWAAKLVIDRLAPAPKGRRIEFELPPLETSADIAVALNAVLQACARGILSPAESAELVATIEKAGGVLVASKFEERIARLEQPPKLIEHRP